VVLFFEVCRGSHCQLVLGVSGWKWC
jgi:hypothetical protein